MEKTIIFLTFILLFVFLIRKDIIYVIPMIFLFYTSINGLLDWEDFAQHGSVKFPDYGLILSLILILYILYFRKSIPESIFSKKNGLLILVYFYMFYYLLLLLYSIILQGSFEWPVKIGRTYFYGFSIFAFYLLLLADPISKYKKIITFLELFTILFSVMYIVYNYFNIDFYANEAYDIIETEVGVVNRNFAAFPYFLMYFYCISLIDFLNRRGNSLKNILLILLYVLCMFSVLTRGVIISAALLFLVAFFISKNHRSNFVLVIAMLAFGFMILNHAHYFNTENFIILVERIREIGDVGIGNTENFAYRTNEFVNVVKNVIQFNPIFGFGFANTTLLGYHFNDLSAGSPDNGFTNLIGVTGFVGMSLFVAIIVTWLLLNIKLQRLNLDPFSKAHFLYILYIPMSFMYGSSNSYIQSFGLFLIYDFLIYRSFYKTLR